MSQQDGEEMSRPFPRSAKPFIGKIERFQLLQNYDSFLFSTMDTLYVHSRVFPEIVAIDQPFPLERRYDVLTTWDRENGLPLKFSILNRDDFDDDDDDDDDDDASRRKESSLSSYKQEFDFEKLQFWRGRRIGSPSVLASAPVFNQERFDFRVIFDRRKNLHGNTRNSHRCHHHHNKSCALCQHDSDVCQSEEEKLRQSAYFSSLRFGKVSVFTSVIPPCLYNAGKRNGRKSSRSDSPRICDTRV